MVNDATLRLIDRQFQLLAEASGTYFLSQLRRCLRLLDREPMVAPYLSDMRREAAELFKRFEAEDDARLDALVALRKELGRAVPDLASSLGKRPTQQESNRSWFTSLEAFDAIASGEDLRGEFVCPHRLDKSKTRRLLHNLRVNLTRTEVPQGKHPELQALADRLQDMEELHEHRWRTFVDQDSCDPGTALVTLEQLLEDVNPAPRIGLDRPSVLERLNAQAATVLNPAVTRLREDLYERQPMGQEATRLLELHRPLVRRVQEDLFRRIGSRHSLETLFARFKARCELHDRGHLRELADASSRPEDSLRDQLALWLFDQGMNPITEPQVGNLRPDLLDPGGLYVEAKQYDEDHPKSKLKKGVNQVYETFARLRSAHPEVSESFYVVFRRAGPYIVFPDCYRDTGSGWVVHFRLIDLATEGIGSEQRRRSQQITLGEIEPERLATAVRAEDVAQVPGDPTRRPDES